MNRTAKTILSSLAWPALAVAVLIGVWYAAAAVTDSSLILPAPHAAAAELFAALGEAAFWRALGGTVVRSLVSYLVSLILAVALGLTAAVCRPVKRFLGPIVAILRSVPTMSVILLALIWTGSEATPIWVALLVTFPLLYTSLTAAHGALDPALEETARIYRVGPLRRAAGIYLPLGLPAFLTSAAGAVSLNLKLTVAAEVLAQTKRSLGLMMQQSQIYFETGRLLALTLAAVAAALVLEGSVLLIRRFAVKKLFG